MFELIVEEDFIANCIVDYIKLQQLYYKTTLQHIELVLEDVGDAISKYIFSFTFLISFFNSFYFFRKK